MKDVEKSALSAPTFLFASYFFFFVEIPGIPFNPFEQSPFLWRMKRVFFLTRGELIPSDSQGDYNWTSFYPNSYTIKLFLCIE